MPVKSHTVKKYQRPPPKHRYLPQSTINLPCYKSLDNVASSLTGLKCLSDWFTLVSADKIILKKESIHKLVFPEYEIIIADNLNFNILVFGWRIPLLHDIYYSSNHTLKNITVFNLLNELKDWKLCAGVPLSHISTNIVIHAVPFKVNYEEIVSDSGSKSYESQYYYRHKGCLILIKKTSNEVCGPCESHMKKQFAYTSVSTKRSLKPAKLNAPISLTSPNRLKLQIQQQRVNTRQLQLENEQLKLELTKMEKELSSKSICVPTNC